jgi:hypothetical protein
VHVHKAEDKEEEEDSCEYEKDDKRDSVWEGIAGAACIDEDDDSACASMCVFKGMDSASTDKRNAWIGGRSVLKGVDAGEGGSGGMSCADGKRGGLL